VLFGKWACTEVLIDGETRLVLTKSDILGLIEGKSRANVRAA
jgi:co-chaperonin GroES (HSP10)